MRPAKPETPNRRRRAHHRRGAVPTRFSCIAKYPNPTQVGPRSERSQFEWEAGLANENSWRNQRARIVLATSRIRAHPENPNRGCPHQQGLLYVYIYRAHKFKPTGLAPRRAEYGIWRKDM